MSLEKSEDFTAQGNKIAVIGSILATGHIPVFSSISNRYYHAQICLPFSKRIFGFGSMCSVLCMFYLVNDIKYDQLLSAA